MEREERKDFMCQLRQIMLNENHDQAEALLQWSENLGALGRVLHWIKDYDDSEGLYDSVAEQLGRIIEDYAFLINHVSHQAYWAIDHFFSNGEHTLVSRAKERYARLKEDRHRCPADIGIIDGLIEEMRPALTDALVLGELMTEFEKMKKDMMAKVRPAAAAAG